MLFVQCLDVYAQNNRTTLIGVNITDYQKGTRNLKKINTYKIKKKIKELYKKGIVDIRLPFSFYKNLDSKHRISKSFKKKIKSLVKYTENKKINLILCNFDEKFTMSTYKSKEKDLIVNWIDLIDYIFKYDTYTQYELLNEPKLYPNEWWEFASYMVSEINTRYPDKKIIIGATNYNSIYELSRLKPLPFRNIVYSFHFYEPFIFTHQGASWINSQNATIGIPYPYSTNTMPLLHTDAYGTDGVVNYKDYDLTGNKKALLQKIGIIYYWSKQYNVPLLCSEFGVIEKANNLDKCNYLIDLKDVLETYNIKGYVWEHEGNFGMMTKEYNFYKCLGFTNF